jgi:uncharacterized protein YbjT (DUF2867 family)
MERIVVIGGTGLIGAQVVARLSEGGHDVLAAAPAIGVDTLTGAGLAEALEGAEVVIDVSNSPSLEDEAAMAFFRTSAANLADAERAAGVSHHVALSVVGTDRLQASGYFRAKLAQERLVETSGIPFTLIRATQFFEFLRGIAREGARGTSVILPHARFQPIAARDVAAALAGAALDAPLGAMREVAGPQDYRIDELVTRVLAHDGDPRTVIGESKAPYFGVALTDASLMPGPDARTGPTTFDWWLANVPPPPAR